MNTNKTILALAMGALGFGSVPAQSAVLQLGDTLTIESGVDDYDAYGYWTGVGSGSWFGMDLDNDGKLTSREKMAITGIVGVRIGESQAAGEIDTWTFLGTAGQHFTTIAPTGGTTHGLDFSGWSFAWNASLLTPMDAGAWTPTNCIAVYLGCMGIAFADGVASFSWDGVYGSTYSLWYSATVPDGDPSGLGNIPYLLHLVGTVEWNHIDPPPVPLPGAAWLLGAGLVGLFGAARRKGRGAG